MLQWERKFKPENIPGRWVVINLNTPKGKKRCFSFEKVEGGWSWCTLASFLMQFDVKELMLSRESIFGSKSRYKKESWAPWRHTFLHPQFCHGLGLSGISLPLDDGISVNFPWESGSEVFYFLFFKLLLIPHPKFKILPSQVTDWYGFFRLISTHMIASFYSNKNRIMLYALAYNVCCF